MPLIVGFPGVLGWPAGRPNGAPLWATCGPAGGRMNSTPGRAPLSRVVGDARSGAGCLIVYYKVYSYLGCFRAIQSVWESDLWSVWESDLECVGD